MRSISVRGEFPTGRLIWLQGVVGGPAGSRVAFLGHIRLVDQPSALLAAPVPRLDDPVVFLLHVRVIAGLVAPALPDAESFLKLYVTPRYRCAQTTPAARPAGHARRTPSRQSPR